MNTCINLKAAWTPAVHFLAPGPYRGRGPVPAPSHGRGSRDWQCPDSFAENISFSERNESLMADSQHKTKNKLNIGLFERILGLFFKRGYAYCFLLGRNN
jgi:hypothetical protein